MPFPSGVGHLGQFNIEHSLIGIQALKKVELMLTRTLANWRSNVEF